MSPKSLSEIEACDPDTGRVNVIIDTPKGNRNKFKYDEERGLFKLAKVLPVGAYFPFDFGFIPSTRGDDGDPLDVLVLLEEPVFVGCLVPARLVGVIEAEQSEDGETVRNDRLIAVAETRGCEREKQALERLAEDHLDEIEHFFISYNQLEGRKFKPLDRHGAKRARRLLDEGREAFRREKRKASRVNGRK